MTGFLRMLARALIGATAWLGLSGASNAPRISADHHVHLLSPDLSRRMMRQCAELKGTEFAEGCADGSAQRQVTDLLRHLDAANARRGTLLSSGYLYSWAAMGLPEKDIPSAIHAENRFTVRQAKLSRGRLVPMIAINPLRNDALTEIDRWKSTCSVAGIKIHVTNSGLQFSNPDHVRRLRAVFARANRYKMAVVIHLRDTSGDYDGTSVTRFLAEVMPAAPDVTVQIAHAGSWGYIDQASLNALRAVHHWFDDHPGGYPKLRLDLAAMDVVKDTGGTVANEMAAEMRAIGLGRFLPASDWPVAHEGYFRRQYDAIPLSRAEWQNIDANEAAYFKPRC